MNRSCTTDRTVLDGKTNIKGFLQLPTGTRIIREKNAHRFESIGDSSRIRNQSSIKPSTGYPLGSKSSCRTFPQRQSIYVSASAGDPSISPVGFAAQTLRSSKNDRPRSCRNPTSVSVTTGPTIMSPRSRDGAIQIARVLVIYSVDFHVGTIAQNWESECGAAMECGFSPGPNRVNTAVEKSRRFDQARADFEGAWRAFSSKRTEADYQAWGSTRLDRT